MSFSGYLTMGFLDIFKDKERHLNHRLNKLGEHVLNSFSSIKSDLNEQKRWISYLHNNHLSLTSSHNIHKESTKKDIETLNAWLNQFDELMKKQENDIKTLQNHINDSIKVYNKHIIELYKRIEEKPNIDPAAMRKEFLDEMNKTIGDFKVQIEHMKNEISKTTVKKETVPEPVKQTLTNPEQKLLNLLFNESDPINYETISLRTGNSINTVRVLMNNLKKHGLVEENTLPNGVKLFSLTNKEKIRKIYNVKNIL